jgi:hypothetical protein
MLGRAFGAERVASAAVAGLTAALVTVLMTVGPMTGDAGLRGGIAALGLLGAAWFFLSPRIEIGLIAVLIWLACFDGFLRLKTGINALTVVRNLILYVVAFGALLRRLRDPSPIRLPPLSGYVFLFGALVLAAVIHPSNESPLRNAIGIRPHLEWVPLFFLGYVALASTRRLRAFLVLLLAVAAINGVVSYVQFKITPQQLSTWGPGYESRIEGETFYNAGRLFYDQTGVQRTRPFALGSDVGFGGLLGMLAIPAMLGLIAVRGNRKLALLVLVLGLGAVLAVATSQQRTGLVGTAVGVLAFCGLALTTRSVGPIVSILVVAAVGYGVAVQLGSQSDSGSFERYETIVPGRLAESVAANRGKSLARLPEYLVEYPLGAGLGNSGPATGVISGGRTTLDSETEFNYLIVETGIPGLLVIAALTLKLLWISVRRIRRIADHDTRILLAALSAPLFGIAVTWISSTPTAVSPTSPYFWTAAGGLAWWLLRPSPQPVSPARTA